MKTWRPTPMGCSHHIASLICHAEGRPPPESGPPQRVMAPLQFPFMDSPWTIDGYSGSTSPRPTSTKPKTNDRLMTMSFWSFEFVDVSI
ncbi:hypothetical protein GWI33_021525 [Rhynchophorus ferrugineus]|uniref:Uncharacterized protein n=1 Tax=Rhynchophorus ferrugineus TaxID=354439 RepID=A0A834I1A1_RHYFE|nr:hypothetical protein GWI33_021525 [Rhynchophorus ferrugineus]